MEEEERRRNLRTDGTEMGMESSVKSQGRRMHLRMAGRKDGSLGTCPVEPTAQAEWNAPAERTFPPPPSCESTRRHQESGDGGRGTGSYAVALR